MNERSLTRRLRLLLAAAIAIGGTVAIGYSSPAAAEVVSAVDDAGPDDEPGQKDLNSLTVDYGAPGSPTLAVTFNFDSLDTTGANTRDGCSLFDTDSDGLANFSLCHTIASSANGGTQTTTLYSCADTTSDRCHGNTVVAPFASTSTSANVAGSDPFKDVASHNSGNTCKDSPACYTDDTVVSQTIVLADVGASAAKLLNVCSYPSEQPNSDPSDCVFAPNNGFLTIVKTVDAATSQQFDFNASMASANGTSAWSIVGAGQVSQVSYKSNTAFNLTEAAVQGWALSSASCAVQTDPPTAIGTPSATGVTGVEVKPGLETICTFDNVRQVANLTVKKQWTNAVVGDQVSITTTGATNNVAFDATADSSTETDTDPTTYSVFPGETLTFAEQFVSADSADYTTTLVCTGAADLDPNDGLTVSIGDQSITCTYTNAADLGTIVVDKAAAGYRQGDTFTFTGDAAGTIDGVGLNGDQISVAVPAGTYTSTEAATSDYALTNIVCVDSETPGSSGDVATGTATFDVDPGETVTCTFTNTRNTAPLTLTKVWGDSVAGDQVVIEADGSDSLSNGPVSETSTADTDGPITDELIVYSDDTVTLKETFQAPADIANYDVTVSCSGGQTVDGAPATIDGQVASYTLDFGDAPAATTCQFTNDARLGTIIIEKDVDGNDGTFDFEGTWTGAANFSIATTGGLGEQTFQGVLAGNYSVTELIDTDQFGVQVDCVDGDAQGANTSADGTTTGTIGLDDGETVICTFFNTENGSITITKLATPEDGTDFTFETDDLPGGDFALDVDGDEDATLTDTNMFVNLAPGTYTVTEADLGGWALTDLTCVDGDDSGEESTTDGATATIELDAAENVTCTYTNAQLGEVTIVKSDPASVERDGDTYSVSYDLTVRNSSFLADTYTLTDTTAFPSNATVTAITVDGPGVVGHDALATPTIVSNGAIAARTGFDGNDPLDFTVVVEFTMTPADGQTEGSQDCSDEPGDGAFNSATVTFGDQGENSDDGCIDLPGADITVEKTAVGTTATHVSGNTYRATFTVDVDNDGEGPGAYTLADLPDFGDGANVVDVEISPEPASPTAIEAGGHDEYTVTVDFTVDGDMAVSERDCGLTETPGQGGYNNAMVEVGEGSDSDSACVDIPNPNVDHSKVVVGGGAVFNGNNEWTVTYQVDVTNLDPEAGIAGPGQYDLTDTFDFGPDVTVDDVEVIASPETLVVVAGFDGDAQNVLADDTPINRNETHTYTIVVDVTIVPSEGTNGDCTSDGGLNNSAGLVVATDTGEGSRPDAEACASYSTLTLLKDVAFDEGGDAQIGDFTLFAEQGETTILTGTSPVAGSVAAGVYALGEVPVAGYSSSGFTCGEFAMNGQTVTVPLGANVVCEIVNEDDPIDVGIVKTHANIPGGTVSPGESYDYVLTVTNHSDRTATNVVVDDQLPLRLTINDITLPEGWDETDNSTGNVIEVATDSMAAGETVQIIVNVTLGSLSLPGPTVINAQAPAPQLTASPLDTLQNTACVDADFDSNEENDCDDDTVDVGEIVAVVAVQCVNDAPRLIYRVLASAILANLPITLTWKPNNPTPNTSPTQLVFDLESGDLGDVTWPGAAFTPSGISIDFPGWRPIQESDYVDGVIPASAQTFNGMILDAAEPDFAWRGETTLTFSVNPEISFTASYPPATAGCAAQRTSDLDIVKLASQPTVRAGGAFQYTLEVTNMSSDGAATSVVLTDPIPANLRVDSITTSTTAFPRWTNCAVTGKDAAGFGGTVRCDLFGPLLQGESAPVVTLGVTANAATPTSNITNVAVVDWVLFDDPGQAGSTNDAAPIAVTAVISQPPVPVAPLLPPTGSNLPEVAARLALLVMSAGALLLLGSRRRRSDAAS